MSFFFFISDFFPFVFPSIPPISNFDPIMIGRKEGETFVRFLFFPSVFFIPFNFFKKQIIKTMKRFEI